MKKVNWPDNETLRNLTIVVIGISTFLGIVLGGIDFLLEKLFQVMS
jgi:preprotein translocase SecE subunit